MAATSPQAQGARPVAEEDGEAVHQGVGDAVGQIPPRAADPVGAGPAELVGQIIPRNSSPGCWSNHVGENFDLASGWAMRKPNRQSSARKSARGARPPIAAEGLPGQGHGGPQGEANALDVVGDGHRRDKSAAMVKASRVEPRVRLRPAR